VDRQAHEDHALICRRAELRKEFRALVALGEMREPTALEQRIATANGHPDLEATQAARRLLARRGIDWQTNGGPA
jgi:hypothetical protein